MIHLDLTSGTPPSPKSNARSLTRFPAGSCQWEKNSPYPYAGAGTGVGS